MEATSQEVFEEISNETPAEISASSVERICRGKYNEILKEILEGISHAKNHDNGHKRF